MTVAPVSPRDLGVIALVDALTDELARAGYAPEETFGYSPERMEQAGLHLVGATVDGRLVGIGGLELQPDGGAELKRFFVAPEHRGAGVADAVLTALLEHAAANGVSAVRLETGDRQAAALVFYRRHGFREIPRFGPYVDSATSICLERATAI